MNQNTEENKNYKQMLPTMALMAFVLGVFVGVVLFGLGGRLLNAIEGREDSDQSSDSADITIDESAYFDADFINQILGIIDQEYIRELNPEDSEQFTYGVIKGLVSSLDDQYTNFLNPEEAAEYYDSRTGDFEGIGVTLEFDGSYTYIETVIAGNPAEAAGLQDGDLIVEVDGEDVTGVQPQVVARDIRGERGTEVKLRVLRVKNEEVEDLTFDITREKIDIDNIFWEKIDEDTARIGIVQFNDESVQKFNDSWDKVVDEIVADMPNLENIVLDIRGNPGGLVDGVKYIAEEFLEEGQTIFSEQARGQTVATFRDNRVGEFEDENVVVLVNRGSASASEILAAAIKDNDHGQIVGLPTTGKGVEQQLIPLDDGSLLIIVFQEWVTAGGQVVNAENPITPDVEVENDPDQDGDEQLQKALEQF